MKHVSIVQANIKRYRVPFFDALYRRLAAADVALTVFYSEPNAHERARGDNTELDPSYGRKVPAWWFLNQRLVWQGVGPALLRSDLVVVEQANKHLINLVLLALRRLGTTRLAFWGHGRNRQATSPAGWAERYKKWIAPHVDWWFAYTAGTARYLEQIGVDPDRITDVQNSIDLRGFRADLAAVDPGSLTNERRALGIAEDAPVLLFCGGLHADKRLPFLIEAVTRARRAVPALALVIVGSGPEQAMVRQAAARLPFVHTVGSKFGQDKARLFRMADLFVMPGLVGLAILDAFAAGLPLVTTDVPFHSPEIEYLRDGRNGVLTAHDPQAYADAIIALLSDRARLARLREGALADGGSYSVEAMAARFAEGVLTCLRR